MQNNINVRQKKSVILTDRDYQVLLYLYERVVVSFRQICERHFASNQRPTVLNRLSLLESAGFIKRSKYPRFEIDCSGELVSVVYNLTPLGLKKLQARHPDQVYRQSLVQIHPFKLVHDLLLNDALEALKIKFQDCEIFKAESSGVKLKDQSLNPDGFIKANNGQELYAIELELTVKSEKRYRELVTKYRLANDISKVIYVTVNSSIDAKILSILGFDPQSKFHFENLKQLLTMKERRTVSNENLSQQTFNRGGIL